MNDSYPYIKIEKTFHKATYIINNIKRENSKLGDIANYSLKVLNSAASRFHFAHSFFYI